MIFVEYLHEARHFFCIFSFIFFSNHASACLLFEPQKTNSISETSGQLVSLKWAGNDSDIYRLQIVANVPEGGIFWTLDTQVKGQIFTFKLPSNLAVIKVQISSNCLDETLSNVQSVKPTDLVNEKKSCSLMPEDWLLDGVLLKFIPRKNILDYSLSLYELRSTNVDSLKNKLNKKIVIKPPYLSMQSNRVDIDLKEIFNLKQFDADLKYIVSVLPRCAAGAGLPLAFQLN